MILVTGATGILGRVIALELVKKGHAVRATKRPTSHLDEVRASFRFYTDEPDFYFDQIKWVDTDFESIKSLEHALEGINEVYHCAAKVSFSPKDDKELFKTNVEGTTNLLYAINPALVKKFLFVSSIAVLDGYNEEGMMDENSDFNSKLTHSGYAISKHMSEMEVWRASAEGLNTIIINPGLIIGSGNWGSSSGDLMAKSGLSVTFPGGTAYVDVRDVARIAIDLMSKNAFGERFILVSENYKYQLISDIVRQAEGKPKAKVISPVLLDLAPVVGTLLGWLIPDLDMLTKSNVEAVRSDSRISNKKITNYLGYHFIPVAESVAFHLKNYLSDRK